MLQISSESVRAHIYYYLIYLLFLAVVVLLVLELIY